MLRKKMYVPAVVALCAATTAGAELVTVNYTLAAGGNNQNPLNGMAASATWETDGMYLSILLENVSTGVPMGAEAADSLLVSLGFDLMDDIMIASGDTAVIGAGSYGVGSWSGMTEGDSVAEEWLWTNDFGGDMMESYAQIISTSSGQGGGMSYLFGGGNPNVSGPFGGIAADPPLMSIPDSKPAVSNSILFTMMLTDELDAGQLDYIARTSIVEFGSDFQYLQVPAPGALGTLLLPFVLGRRRR